MNKQKKLSMKDRLTIRMKSIKPARLSILLAVCLVLLVALIVMGLVDGKPTPTSAPAELAGDNVQFRMTIAGDVSFDDNTQILADKLGHANLLDGVSSYWADADVVVANLSGPVLENDRDTYDLEGNAVMAASSYFDVDSLNGLFKSGITLPSFANDGVFNYGTAGIESTMRVLDASGIPYLGIASVKDQIYYKTYEFPKVLADDTLGNGSVSIVSINDVIRDGSTVTGYRPGIINSGVTSVYLSVYELSQISDQVIVYVHFGEINSGKITDEQRSMAQRLIDAGADVVVGTHSHMVQPVERYADGLIIYDLGELISTEDYSLSSDGVLMDFVIDNNGEAFVYLTPTHIIEGSPRITNNLLYQKRIQSTLTEMLPEDDFEIMEDGIVRVSLESANAG